MSENITFRTSLGGFNRSDVMNYIKALMSEKEADVKKLADLEESRLSDKQRISELEENVKKAADCANCDVARKNKEIVGAALLDARRFSDLIVDEANEKIAKMAQAAAADAFFSSEQASALAAKLRETAEEYAAAFNTLLGKMTALSDALGVFGNEIIEKNDGFLSAKEKTAGKTGKNTEKKQNTENNISSTKWMEPMGEGVFDPDFNFLDSEDDYAVALTSVSDGTEIIEKKD